MRMVCFLPGVTPDAVCLCMCEPSARLQWDENYRHFEKFTDDDAVTDVKQRTRPIRDVCGKTAVCVGDRCLLSPVIGENRTESAWFSHRVSTGFAASLGQPDRLFFYLRRTFTYLFQDNGDAFHPMIDVLYDGSSSMFEHANAKSGAFQMWAAKQREKTFHSAWMNYQHACFVPITNFEQQITPETVTEISTTGSMFDVKSSKSFYKLFSESRELQRVGNGGVSGTLLVMTSANDIGIPPFLPRWSQKKIMVYVATRDFDHLMQLLQSPPQ
ncbi:hypothetical protein AGDE_12295 [Angomonas deanei]|uniref:START domain containing protein n=1 Tax=Angomonas deanei TaxID=59799 RepID=A0A7G2C406_9TRYP|nr:hypothetical protein AGDE_12295 [Angomonas deanei]CAD2213453.1 hypothetical protein, conserved [Angomonas deanei]|eukprot:EPY24541.1 hypothetical protein AGDE_12295 [Angomonas deanei]